MRVMHALALDCFGGIQTQALDVVARQSETPGVTPSILDATGRPDVEVSRRFSSLGVLPSDRKRWQGLKIPRWPRSLRRARLRSIMASVAPDVVVVADHLATLQDVSEAWDGPIVYHERGSAWVSDDASCRGVRTDRLAGLMFNSIAGQRIFEERIPRPASLPSRIVPNGLRPGAAPALRPPSRSHRPDGILRLGFIGRLVPRKGVGAAILAAVELRRRGVRVHLEIAGIGPEESSLRTLATSRGLDSDLVSFSGLLTAPTDFYERIDLLLVPSINECFGNVAVEAMAHGVPVVASRIDGLAEVVEHGRCGLTVPCTLHRSVLLDWGLGDYALPERVVDPDAEALQEPRVPDPVHLADGIENIAGDRDLLRSMGSEGRARVEREFAFDRFIERYHAALADFVSRAG